MGVWEKNEHVTPIPSDGYRPAPAAQGVVVLTAALAAMVACGYGVHAVATRALTPADYGRFAVTLSVITWLKICISSVLVPGISKVVSEDARRLRPAIRLAARWYGGGALVIGILLLPATPLMARAFGDPALTPLLALACLEAPLFAAFGMGRQLLSAVRHYAQAAASLWAYAVVRAAAACGFILLGWGALGALGGLAAGSLAGAIVGLTLLRRVGAALPVEEHPPMLRRAFSWTAMTIPSSVAVATLMSMDMWLVKGSLHDAAAVGIYGAAFAMSRLPDFLVQGLAGAVFGRVSGALSEGRPELARSVSREAMRYLLVTFIPICALIAGSDRQVAALLFGQAYSSAGPILTLLTCAVSLSGALKLFQTLLAAGDRPGARLTFVLALLPTGLALNLLLIARYGAMGAAVAMLITMSLGALSGLYLVRRCLGVTAPLACVIRCAVAGTAVYALGRAFPGLTGWLLPVKMAVLGLIYAVGLFLLRELTPEDLLGMWKTLGGIGGGRKRSG